MSEPTDKLQRDREAGVLVVGSRFTEDENGNMVWHAGLIEPDPELSPVWHTMCGACCDEDPNLDAAVDFLIKSGLTSLYFDNPPIDCPACIERLDEGPSV